jgi:hypothetical protein
MARAVLVAAYVAVVSVLVAVSLMGSSEELAALGLIGFLCASTAFAYAFLRSSPQRRATRSTRETERRAERQEAEHYDAMAGEPVFVFAVDGVDVFPSVGDAATCIEAFEVEDGDLQALFTLDGRIVHAHARGVHVVLTVTPERDVWQLRSRLRSYVETAGLASSPDDVRAVANEMLRDEWEGRWPKRPRWLDERLHGDGPVQV